MKLRVLSVLAAALLTLSCATTGGLDPLIEQISGQPAAQATEAYRSSLIRALQVIAEGVASADREPVISFTTAISEQRAREGISITTMLHVFDGMRAYVWEHLERYIAQDPGWQHHEMNVNYFGAQRVTRAVLPAMITRGRSMWMRASITRWRSPPLSWCG